MKKIISFLLFCNLVAIGYSQVNTTVQCPPCRPVAACGLCWESQQQADDSQCDPTLSVDDLENAKANIVITPNPIKNGSFTVSSSQLIDGNMTIVSQLGAIIQVIPPSATPANFRNIELKLQSGLYFMIYQTTDQTGKSIKVTKKLLFTNN